MVVSTHLHLHTLSLVLRLWLGQHLLPRVAFQSGMLLLRIHDNLPSVSTPEAKQCNFHTIQPKHVGAAGSAKPYLIFIMLCWHGGVELNGMFQHETVLQRFPFADCLCVTLKNGNSFDDLSRTQNMVVPCCFQSGPCTVFALDAIGPDHRMERRMENMGCECEWYVGT